jgi:hypothetical protein
VNRREAVAGLVGLVATGGLPKVPEGERQWRILISLAADPGWDRVYEAARTFDAYPTGILQQTLIDQWERRPDGDVVMGGASRYTYTYSDGTLKRIIHGPLADPWTRYEVSDPPLRS